MYGSCLAARRSKFVGGMCSVLPYGIGICCYTFNFFFFIASVHSFFILKKNLVVSTERSTVLVCPSLSFFFSRGDTKGTNSSKILCLMFVFALFYANLCQD